MDDFAATQFLTPEQLKAKNEAFGQEDDLLQKQLAQAQALRNKQQPQHSTGIGALFGGLGGVADAVQGNMREEQANKAYGFNPHTGQFEGGLLGREQQGGMDADSALIQLLRAQAQAQAKAKAQQEQAQGQTPSSLLQSIPDYSGY